MKLHPTLRRIVAIALTTTSVLSCNRQNVEIIQPTFNIGNIQMKSDLKDENAFTVSQQMAEDYFKLTFGNKSIVNLTPISQEGLTCAYLIDYNNGWCLVSGDTRIQPILGYDDTCSISLEDICESPALSTWLNSLIDDIIGIKINNDIVSNEHTQFWARFNSKRKKTNRPATKSLDEPVWALFYDETTLDNTTNITNVPHLLITKWGQGGYYYGNPKYNVWNYKCPWGLDASGDTLVKCPTGCTAVAMAQVLYYMHFRPSGKPSGLYHTINCSGYCLDELNYSVSFSRGDYVANSSRWNDMALHYYNNHTDYVGDLMMDVGNRVDMTYSGTASGAFPTNASFNYYSLQCNTASYNFNYVKNDLDAHRPVVIYAYDSHTPSVWPFSGNYSNAHTWVIDGYRELTYYYTNHYHLEYTTEIDDAYIIYVDNEIESEFDEYYDGMEVEEQYETHTDYLLMNWGSDGSYDGGQYYLSDASGWSAGGYNFRYLKTILYNIRPLN